MLILGGTSEATALARALTGRMDIAASLSLAGRTRAPAAQPLPTRIGGFGGIEGLATYLRHDRIDVLVDATHPFATQISRHAREAARLTHCSLIALTRSAWQPQRGDDWHEVEDMDGAVTALGETPQRVFLTVGRLQLAAFAKAPRHHYLVRTIDPVDDHGLPGATFIEARGPFDAVAEERLMRDHRIDILVTKNSGGEAAAGKLHAARALGFPVILVRRPEQGGTAMGVAEAIAAIKAHRASARRGV